MRWMAVPVATWSCLLNGGYNIGILGIMVSRPNDRQIVEQMVIPATLTAIVTVMRKQLPKEAGNSPELDRVHALLEQSLREPVSDLPADRVAKLVRRARRGTTEAITPLFAKYPLATQYLTVAYLVAELTKEEIISVGAQLPFAEAWDIMMEVMGCVVDKLPEMDPVATIEAVKLRSRLAALGYFA